MRDYGKEDELWLISRNILATEDQVERFKERVGIVLDGATDEKSVAKARVDTYKGIFGDINE